MSDSPWEKCKTPEDCENLERNALARGNAAVATGARQRAIELRARAHGGVTAAERECIEAVYAYERARSTPRRKFRAARTWQMIERHGVIPAVERTVTRSGATTGYETLVAHNLERFAFEAVVLRHPEQFSAETVAKARDRPGSA